VAEAKERVVLGGWWVFGVWGGRGGGGGGGGAGGKVTGM